MIIWSEKQLPTNYFSSVPQIQTDLNLTIPGLISYMTSRALSQQTKPVYVGVDAPAQTTYPEIVTNPWKDMAQITKNEFVALV